MKDIPANKKETSSAANVRSMRRLQIAAEQTNINLLRYILDYPNAVRREAAIDLGMSFPNVCRLVRKFTASGILIGESSRQASEYGPSSQVLLLRPELGCSIGIDVEATQVRGIILDFANSVTDIISCPVTPTNVAENALRTAITIAGELAKRISDRNLKACALGLALPGRVLDVALGRVALPSTQEGIETVDFVPAIASASGIRTFAADNSYCFAAGHHRMLHPRSDGMYATVLNRYGLGAVITWGGRVFTGSHYNAGRLEMLPCSTVDPPRPYYYVCTGSALLQRMRSRGDKRSLQEILDSPSDPMLQEWLREAIPAFAQAIYCVIEFLRPERTIVEGIFNRLPEEIRERVIAAVVDQFPPDENFAPEIQFFDGDDLMGARGAALLARDNTKDEILANILQSHESGHPHKIPSST